MKDTHLKLGKAIENINNILLEEYNSVLSENKVKLKSYIDSSFGGIKKIEPLSKDILIEYEKLGGIVGVDGSNNKVGGTEPHYIEFYQGLAKSTKIKELSVIETDYYTPMEMDFKTILEEDEDEEVPSTKIRRKKLAEVEIEVALRSIDELKPMIIMMDGSLLRYKIESKEKWELLKNRCTDEGIILIGIVEDIKTKVIGDFMKTDNIVDKISDFYDREILYGLLDYGEVVFIPNDGEISKKYREGISSAFIKSSTEPTVIAIDIMENQIDSLEDMIGLVLSLTPKNSRGIPLWLDIVDSEVRIEDKMINGLLESNMDKKLIETFFKAERDKRTF